MQYEPIISWPVYPRVSVFAVISDVLCISSLRLGTLLKGIQLAVTVIPHQKSIDYFETDSDLK